MRRALALLLAVLLPAVPGAPAWATVIRSAAPASAPISAVPGLQLSAPSPGSSLLGPSPTRNGSLGLQGSLPSWSGPQATISPAPAPAPAPALESGRSIAGRASLPQAAGPAMLIRVRTAASPQGEAPMQGSLEAMRSASALGAQSLRQESLDESYGTSRAAFDRLIGAGSSLGDQAAAPEAPVPAVLHTIKGRLSRSPEDAGKPAAPSPEDPAPKPDIKPILRWYLGGTAAFKIGMEALGLSIPLIALSVFGQVKWAAVMSVGWGLSQLVFSSLAGGILDRHSPTKVISRAMTLQAASVGVMIGLFAVDNFFPALLGFPLAQPVAVLILYSLAGACLGVQDTARQVIPAEVIGKDEKAIKLFNARTHMAYEVSGVVGALLAGLVISKFGVLAALLLHPPAYLAAAWIFSHIRMGHAGSGIPPQADAPAPAIPGGRKSPAAAVRAFFTDLAAGARAMSSGKLFRWGMFALVVPVLIHRVLEGLLIPVAAKSLLGNPSAAAWLIGASNLGELIGAGLLLRSLTRANGKGHHTAFWVRLMAAGTLAFWAFSLTDQLAVILPLVLFMSASWAASDLSLRSKLQNAIPGSLRGRAFGFLSAVSFALILTASLGLGFLFDAAAHAAVFLGISGALTILAVALFFSAKGLLTKTEAETQVKDSK